MTISAIDTGSVLYFSHDELPTVRPLTQEAVLPALPASRTTSAPSSAGPWPRPATPSRRPWR